MSLINFGFRALRPLLHCVDAETAHGLTIKALKTVVRELVKDESKRDVQLMQDVVNTCFRSKDYIEGRDAFMEKRKPVFTGT